MKFSELDLIGGVLLAFCVSIVLVTAGEIGRRSFRDSEKAAAFQAYTDCLRETKAQPIAVIQSFCDKIKDQL